MSKVKDFVEHHWQHILLWVMIIGYIGYFSFFTIMRFRNLYASYFDLGIMHQAVYNSFEAIKTGDWSRFLEHTNPHGVEQVKRMAIHNDVILGVLSIFYFIYSGPETLLIIQSLVIGLGAWAVYLIAQQVFQKNGSRGIWGLIFAFAYLLYPPLQRSNIYEFHAVVLSTTFLLYMFYFWLVKKYGWSLLFFLLSLSTKENIALTTVFFGIYCLYTQLSQISNRKSQIYISKLKSLKFPLLVILISIIWFMVSMLVIIPYFRGGKHFALGYYADVKNITQYLFHVDTFRYLLFLLGPLGFISFLSPSLLLITLPEFAINLLSNSWNMRNIVFHYTAVITPFIFISAIYGVQRLIYVKGQMSNVKNTDQRLKVPTSPKGFDGQGKCQGLKSKVVVSLVIVATIVFAYLKGPLPFSVEADLYPITIIPKEKDDIVRLSIRLQSDIYKISATDHFAPYFTSRRYFYVFSKAYKRADYVIISVYEATKGWRYKETKDAYLMLQKDPSYRLDYKNGDLEVYKKIK